MDRSPASDQSLAPWLRPVIIAAVVARVASFVVLPPLGGAYQRLTTGSLPPQFTGHGTLRGLFLVLPFAWWLGCAGLFAWAYRSRAWLRRDVAHNHRLFAVAAAFGSAQWILGELLVFRDYRWGLGRALLIWLVEIAIAAPLLIWAIREFHPRGHVVAEEPQLATGVNATARDGGYRRLVAGIALLVPSLYGIRWLFTDPDAGYLMILWIILFFAEMIAAGVGVSVLLAGIRILRGLQVKRSVQLGPIVLVGGAILMVVFYVIGHP